MKKICLVFFAVMSGVFAGAQVQFGVKAGLNLTTLTYSGPASTEPAWKTSFNAGLLASVPLSSGFYLQPEIMYSGQGYEHAVANQSGHYELSYLNVPVLFRYQHESGLFAVTGPQIGFLLSADAEVGGNKTDIKDQFQTTDFSWAFGLGYKFSKIGLGIDARYNLGITNLAKDSPDETIKNSVFQLGLFYMLNFN